MPPALPAVCIGRQKLLQVCINLLLNARDAGEGGQESAWQEGGAGTGCGSRSTDEGSGIDAELLPHIFDPFFTTKPPGKGRGLGLFVCHRIIEEAGGRIEVRSRPGEGETFTLLPKRKMEDEPELKQILVVDDEAPMRHMLRLVLEKEGYGVTEAAGGESGFGCTRRQDLRSGPVRYPDARNGRAGFPAGGVPAGIRRPLSS